MLTYWWAAFLRSELRRVLGEGESNSKQNVVNMVVKKGN